MSNNIVFFKLFVSIYVIFSISCSFARTELRHDDEIGYVKDSINEYGQHIKLFGNDSVYTFASVANGSLSSILYLKDNYPIKRKLYKNGQLEYIEYNYLINKKSPLEEYYYSQGSVQSRIFSKDTIIVTDQNPIHCITLFVEYHLNGQIKESGCMGTFSGQNIPVGLWTIYDDQGKLISTKNYIYPPQKKDATTETVHTNIVESEYYDGGNLKSEKRYKNYVFYESDEESKVPIGLWKYYNKGGKLIKTEKH